MKNIIFIDSYYDSIYGAQKSMLTLASLLKKTKASLNVTIGVFKLGKLSSSINRDLIDILDFNSQLIILNSIRSNKKNYLYFFYYLLNILLFWLKTPILFVKLKKFDKICINDYRSILLLLPSLILLRNRTIWYVRIREDKNILLKFLSHIPKKIICISTNVYNEFDYLNNKEMLKTGFDNKEINFDLEIQSNEIKMVTVGSINERKNQIELINQYVSLYEKLHKKQIKISLDIIGGCEKGDEDYFERVINLVNSESLIGKNIKILGYKDNADSLLKNYDVFLFSSLREGLPRSVIEALQSGCFIISNKVDGIDDIVKHKSYGYVYDIFDADMISKILSDNFYEIKSYNNKVNRNKYVNCEFSKAKFVDGFISILEME